MSNNRRIKRTGSGSSLDGLSNSTLRKLSDIRRAEIRDSVSDRAERNDSSGYLMPQIAHSGTFRKRASLVPPVLPSSSNFTDRMAPDLYSPLFQLANLNLPRDRVTMNAWNRIFYDTHPIVRNAINLHSSYPISKINITCKSKEVQNFFLEMAERIDLYSVVYSVALEFWKMGEAFPYAELDSKSNTWKRITVLNPDFIHVKKSVVGDKTIVSMRPDASLQRLVNSSSPSDILLKRRIPRHIVDYVKKGLNIPLDNLNIAHLKLLSSPYDIRGTSVIVSVYKDLMLYDKLRECYDIHTEIMTSDGFKNYTDVIDSNGNLKDKDLKVACYNEDTNNLEYHTPSKATVWHNDGKMIHFKGEKVDCMVTPNHRMYAAKKTKAGWGKHKVILAEKITRGNYYKFKSSASFSESEFKDTEYVYVGDTDIPIDDYLKFAGYVVSEGCIYSKLITRGNSTWYDRKIHISQQPTSDCYEDIKDNFQKVADLIGRKLSQSIVHQSAGFSAGNPQDIWRGAISDQSLTTHCIEEFGTDGRAGSYDKKIPRWILNLPPSRQRIMLDALVAGDGSVIPSSYKNGNTIAYRYCTVSKQLADDVYEMVYKCGFVPNINTVKRDDRDFEEYTVLWSDGNYGNEPLIYGNPNYGGANINEVDYDDKVWCLEVPTGLFVTRRNNKLTIQGNSKFAQADGMVNPLTLVKLGGSNDYRPTQSDIDNFKMILEEAQYDKDFKLVTHDGVTIERVGFSGQTMDIAPDIELINNNIYAGLMVPKSLMDQESACLTVEDNDILTERGWVSYDDLGDDDKIGTLNPETNALEFHSPTFKKDYDFSGMMFHFKNQEVDVKVTDFHEMYLSRDGGETYSKERALGVFDIKDINSEESFSSKHKSNVRFQTAIKSWKGEAAPDFVCIPTKTQYTGEIVDVHVPTDDYLEFIGYYLSEGHLRRRNHRKNKDIASIEITQQPYSKGYDSMKSLFERFSYSTVITGESNNRHGWNVCNKSFSEYIFAECGEKSHGKRIPEWIKRLSKPKLEIVLDAMMLGDGHFLKNSSSGSGYYATVSRQLADDVQEIAFKCGYVTNITEDAHKNLLNEKHRLLYKVKILKNDNCLRGPIRKTNPIVKPSDTSVSYVENCRVFCVEVPNHIFITRHNGKIAIHGNTYASSSVGLEVLRQRYDIFRNMLKKWLERKIFAPICELQDFFEYVDGEKKLIVPSIDFNHMNLYDMNDYIQAISQFVGQKQISIQTLYRSIGLSYEEEKRRLKEESIDFAVAQKEATIMQGMKLVELMNLDPDKAVPEPTDSAIPGGPQPGGEMMGGIPGVGGPPGLEGGPPGGGMPDMPLGPPPGGGGPPPGGGGPEGGGGLPPI